MTECGGMDGRRDVTATRSWLHRGPGGGQQIRDTPRARRTAIRHDWVYPAYHIVTARVSCTRSGAGMSDDYQRVSSFIDRRGYDAFMRMAAEDGISMSDRIATMVKLWLDDPEVRRRVEAHARDVSIERRRRQYDRRRTTSHT